MTNWYVASKVRTDGRRGYAHMTESTWLQIAGDPDSPGWRIDSGPFADPGEADAAAGLQSVCDVMES